MLIEHDADAVVSCSRNVICSSVNSWTEASSITALTWLSNSTGSTMLLRGITLNRAELIGTALAGISVISMRRLSIAHWPIRPSPSRNVCAWPLAPSSA